jgi:hypothetical protein
VLTTTTEWVVLGRGQCGHRDRCAVGLLGLSGAPVHRRGYRLKWLTVDTVGPVADQGDEQGQQRHRTPERTPAQAALGDWLINESPPAAPSGRVRMNPNQNNTMLLMVMRLVTST